MKVLITGANGMVAYAMAKHCRSKGDDVLALVRRDLDIADSKQVSGILHIEKPDAVINCAAFTDVDGAETRPEESYKANANGVENLASGCKEIDAGFLTISTDFVFDGTSEGFYTQRDTPNPISVYGKSKLEGEERARKSYARSIVVRSGWIYGENGTNFLSVLHKLLADGKSIKAIHDSFGTPTFANDLASRIRELILLDLPNTYHVTNSGEGTSYAGFAEKVCDIKGYDESLLERSTAESLKRPAPRPKSSKMRCLFSEKLGLLELPAWEVALGRFLESKSS